jgi:uncharacterized membrane protein YgcG
MDERFYQILVGVLIMAVIFAILKPSKPRVQYQTEINTMLTAADGLDLRAVGALVKKASTAEDLERLLNDKSEGVNNLDLDEDGNVDYVEVTEYGDDTSKGFSLSVEPIKGEEQEIATIQIEKKNDQDASVQVHGNQNIYGPNHYYHSYYPLSTFLLWSYLLRPHPFYVSPWYYGYYPSYYRPYGAVGVSSYRTRTAPLAKSANMRKSSQSMAKSTVKSPNAGKSAKSIKTPLRNPSKSQKSFQARNPSKQARSGGFGRKSSSQSKPSVRSSSWSRSGGSFGGK